MSRVLLSLNFMYCIECFATQIYRTQFGAFGATVYASLLNAASQNENEHFQKFRTQVKKLSGKISPIGFLFQFMGFVLGNVTRILGKKALFKADTYVETRAVKDYNSFIKHIPLDRDTIKLIRGINNEEEVHVDNWKRAEKALNNKKLPAA